MNKSLQSTSAEQKGQGTFMGYNLWSGKAKLNRKRWKKLCHYKGTELSQYLSEGTEIHSEYGDRWRDRYIYTWSEVGILKAELAWAKQLLAQQHLNENNKE